MRRGRFKFRVVVIAIDRLVIDGRGDQFALKPIDYGGLEQILPGDSLAGGIKIDSFGIDLCEIVRVIAEHVRPKLTQPRFEGRFVFSRPREDRQAQVFVRHAVRIRGLQRSPVPTGGPFCEFLAVELITVM
jgi:hypothetical protein